MATYRLTIGVRGTTKRRELVVTGASLDAIIGEMDAKLKHEEKNEYVHAYKPLVAKMPRIPMYVH